MRTTSGRSLLECDFSRDGILTQGESQRVGGLLRPGRFRMSRRKAAFTALAVRKIRATSGAKTTTLEPDANRSAYLPRTPAEKSYSARISSRFRRSPLAPLIGLSLRLGRESSTDDADHPAAALDVHHDDEATVVRTAHEDEAVLLVGMIGIEDCQRKRITERGCRILE